MSRPQPRPLRRPSYEKALVAYRAADLDGCLRLLDGLDFERPTILRVRALTRLGQFDVARQIVVDAPIQDAGDVERAELNTLYANLAVRMGRHDIDTAFEDAQHYIEATESRNLRAELDFVRGRRAWVQGDLGAAEAFLERALAAGDDDATSLPHMQHVQAFALDVLGLIEQDRERFDRAAAYHREGLDVYDRAAVKDEWVAGYGTANLALLARDFPAAIGAGALGERIARVAWGPSIADRRFLALHGLGWARAHEGDHVGALRAFHYAADVAPTQASKVTAWVDHAQLGREVGAGPIAEESARSAADTADTVAWGTVPGMDRVVLLFLAEMLAPLDARAARSLLKRYEATRGAEDRSATAILGSANVRWRCFELRAEAAVAAAEGRTDLARSLYLEELAAWRRIGSAPRTAVAALDAYALRPEPGLLELAGEAAAQTPHSWVARRHAALVASR